VATSCEHGNEVSISINGCEFHDQLKISASQEGLDSAGLHMKLYSQSHGYKLVKATIKLNDLKLIMMLQLKSLWC
jgi:hypothetical protein